MIRKTVTLGFLVAALNLQVACSDKDDAKSEESADAMPAGLLGSWKVQSCQSSDSSSSTSAVTFQSTTAVITGVLFSDTKCATELLSVVYNITYVSSGTATKGIYNIDETLTKVTMKVKDTDWVDSYNQAAFYGKTDWAVDKEVDITGQDSSSGAGDAMNAGSIDYNIYQLTDSSTLCFGMYDDAHQGDSAATRPTKIDSTGNCVIRASLALKESNADRSTLLNSPSRHTVLPPRN